MRLLKEISEIDIEYIGEQNLRAIPDLILSNQEKKKLPTRFYINGDWRIRHTCVQCDSEVLTGADEPILEKNPNNFNRLPYLREKHFKLGVLKEFEQLFINLILVKIQGEFKLLNVNYDENFPLPVALFQYTCKHCSTCYFAKYNRGYGSTGERGESPTPDLMFIDEIVAVSIEKNQENALFSNHLDDQIQ